MAGQRGSEREAAVAAVAVVRPRGRDRAHWGPGRPHRVNARFSAAELAEVEAAAAAVGMTPAGFLAEAGLAAARGTAPAVLDPLRESLAGLQAELFDVRVAVGRIGTNLNQAVAAFNATGVAPDWLARAVALCERRLAGVDAVITVIDGRLR